MKNEDRIKLWELTMAFGLVILIIGFLTTLIALVIQMIIGGGIVPISTGFLALLSGYLIMIFAKFMREHHCD